MLSTWGPPVQWDRLGQQEKLDPRVPQAQTLRPLARLDLREYKATQARLGLKVMLVPLVPRERRGTSALQAPKGIQVQPARKVMLVPQDRRVIPARQDPKAMLGLLVHKETSVQQGQPARRAILAQLVHRVKLVPPAPRGT